MSEKPISPLRQRMLEDMSVRRFTPDTQREYIRAVNAARGNSGWPVLISPWVVVLACGFSMLVGVIFGSYPAYCAARLDPMVALRYE
jgi:ABC-type lipoprotein release transport system permease subunit